MSSKIVPPQKLKGFRDILPKVMAKKVAMIHLAREISKKYGFCEIQTPALEYETTLLGQGSEETDKQVYRFLDHGDRNVALRFDLTIPFARYVVENFAALSFPFRKLQVGEVWRGENTQKGRYREFSQCDLDIIGVDSLATDVEILSCFADILSELKLGGVTFRISHRPLLNYLIAHVLGLTETARIDQVLIAIDKLGKMSVADISGKLSELTGRDAGMYQNFFEMLKLSDENAIVKSVESSPEASAHFERLMQTIAILKKSSPDDVEFKLDLTIARGLGYYNGIVFETQLTKLPDFGSICSGGRYNDLVSRFSNHLLAGVGASIGLDRLLAGLEELNAIEDESTSDVLIALATADATTEAHQLAQDIRAEGLVCELGLQPKLAQQFKYADKNKITWVVVLGTEEVKNNVVTLKHMTSGTEHKNISKSELFQKLQKLEHS